MKSLAVFLVAIACCSYALAQAPVITSFSLNGELVCSNLVDGSVASVEWASSLDGPWHTDWAGLDTVTVAGDGTIRVSVPMFYRVRGFSPSAPTATTTDATLVTSVSVTMNGTGTPNGSTSYGYFRYSTTNPGAPNDSFDTRAPTSSASDTYLDAGRSPVSYSRSISSLTPGTTYYYCAIVRNAYGTSFGSVLSFTTPAGL